MSALAGYGSLAKNSTNTLATVTNAELDISADMYDTTVINAGRAKTFIPGLYGATFPCKLNFDPTDTYGSLAFQSNLISSSPTTIAFTLSPNGGTNNYTFSGYIKDMKLVAPVNGLVTFDTTVQITGSVSYA